MSVPLISLRVFSSSNFSSVSPKISLKCFLLFGFLSRKKIGLRQDVTIEMSKVRREGGSVCVCVEKEIERERESVRESFLSRIILMTDHKKGSVEKNWVKIFVPREIFFPRTKVKNLSWAKNLGTKKI